MPISTIGSESLLITLIWSITLYLSLAALTILFTLVVRRYIANRNDTKLMLSQAELASFFNIALHSPHLLSAASLPILEPAFKGIACQTALDILRISQGQDIKVVVKILNEWQLFPYLCLTLSTGSRGKQIQCLTILKYFEDTESLTQLLKYAQNNDHYVQLAALRGLSYRGAINYLDTLVESIGQSKQTNMLMLADILARFGESALPALHRLAGSKASIEVRLAAIMALGDIGSLTSAKVLNKLLADTSQDIRAQAIANLGKSGSADTGALLLPYLKDQSSNVRIQTAYALGLINLKSTIPSLIKALNDEEWWVRYRAAEALYKFGERGIALLKTLRNQNTPAGIIANQLLAERQEQHAG